VKLFHRKQSQLAAPFIFFKNVVKELHIKGNLLRHLYLLRHLGNLLHHLLYKQSQLAAPFIFFKNGHFLIYKCTFFKNINGAASWLSV